MPPHDLEQVKFSASHFPLYPLVAAQSQGAIVPAAWLLGGTSKNQLRHFQVAENSIQRRLAAILAADVVGYSRLMGQDEAGTLTAVRRLRTELIEPSIAEHQGRLFKSMGDGFLAEFSSVVNAVACAVAIQRRMAH